MIHASLAGAPDLFEKKICVKVQVAINIGMLIYLRHGTLSLSLSLCAINDSSQMRLVSF